MSIYAAAAVVCVALVIALIWLLRSRRVREKYAATWIVLTVAVVLLGAFPGLAFWLSHLVGVQTPVNLVFAVGIVVLLAVCVQLSTEVTGLEEETRTLAEEVALLRLDLEQLRDATAAAGGSQQPAGPDAPGTGAPADPVAPDPAAPDPAAPDPAAPEPGAPEPGAPDQADGPDGPAPETEVGS